MAKDIKYMQELGEVVPSLVIFHYKPRSCPRLEPIAEEECSSGEVLKKRPQRSKSRIRSPTVSATPFTSGKRIGEGSCTTSHVLVEQEVENRGQYHREVQQDFLCENCFVFTAFFENGL
ncbi:hypothetical protein V6N11_032461 [Hibiscus sabdariffa]|uniref:Uncharacterized protein n=1 Tax=Hibiscus sabdariffa TaxID=183260 RepID=A0ABR2T0Q3_9ROSI